LENISDAKFVFLQFAKIMIFLRQDVTCTLHLSLGVVALLLKLSMRGLVLVNAEYAVNLAIILIMCRLAVASTFSIS
jgi:hypothetical protein